MPASPADFQVHNYVAGPIARNAFLTSTVLMYICMYMHICGYIRSSSSIYSQCESHSGASTKDDSPVQREVVPAPVRISHNGSHHTCACLHSASAFAAATPPAPPAAPPAA